VNSLSCSSYFEKFGYFERRTDRQIMTFDDYFR